MDADLILLFKSLEAVMPYNKIEIGTDYFVVNGTRLQVRTNLIKGPGFAFRFNDIKTVLQQLQIENIISLSNERFARVIDCFNRSKFAEFMEVRNKSSKLTYYEGVSPTIHA